LSTALPTAPVVPFSALPAAPVALFAVLPADSAAFEAGPVAFDPEAPFELPAADECFASDDGVAADPLFAAPESRPGLRVERPVVAERFGVDVDPVAVAVAAPP